MTCAAPPKMADADLARFLEDGAHIRGTVPGDRGETPDFVLDVGRNPVSVELAEICGATDGMTYCELASRTVWSKHAICWARGFFHNPVILILESHGPRLIEIRKALERLALAGAFTSTGFEEIWAMDAPEPGGAKPDMFCFKPVDMLGFHRIGRP